MDLSCIILSGDLELYVLGQLSEAEAVQITALAAIFPEVQAEIERITTSLIDTAAHSSQYPQPGLKAKVLQQLQTESAAVVPMFTSEPPPPKVVSMQKQWGKAIAAALVISCGVLLFLLLNNRQSKTTIARLEASSRQLQDSLANMRAQHTANATLLNLVQNPAFNRVVLESVQGKATAAQVYWNPATSEVYLVHSALPPAPVGKQYQLWAIVSGKPVNAGLLEPKQVQQMKSFASADAFAITLENSGGSAVPTLEAMVVLGKTS